MLKEHKFAFLRTIGKNPAVSPPIKFPNEMERNQIPIINPVNLAGANFVVALIPTGLKHNSPRV